MEKSPTSIDFDRVSKVINSNFEEHKNQIKKCCMKSSIIPLSDYYESLQTAFKNAESCSTPPREKPDPLEYIELFKAFDEYPSNLQKPKKPLYKESSRINATMKSKTNSSSTSINTSKLFDEQPSAAVIYNEFSKYTEKLSNFREELHKQTTSKEYNEKLQNINTFARELDKLLQSKEVGADAFTPIEEEKLKLISQNMEHFAFIQENQDLYSHLNNHEASSARLGDLVDIVTDALVAINCYKSS